MSDVAGVQNVVDGVASTLHHHPANNSPITTPVSFLFVVIHASFLFIEDCSSRLAPYSDVGRSPAPLPRIRVAAVPPPAQPARRRSRGPVRARQPHGPS